MTKAAATFVLEQHVGHRTYANNLRESCAGNDRLDVHWVPVNYSDLPAWARKLPCPAGVRAALAGRHEVRVGLGSSRADVALFNTQVPAALGGRAARAQPYVVVTDVTPVQYDQMGEGYGHRSDRLAPVRNLKHRANKRVFGDAYHCVGWSSWAASSIVDDYGVDTSRVSVIPPGVDLGRWQHTKRTPDEHLRIIFVGGEFERKGGSILLEAFAQLSADWELIVVTNSKVPSADRVTVVNDLTPNDPRLVDLYQSSDVFVLPSLAETFGIAAVEASAAGLPLVTTSIGGLPDILIPNETGLSVRAGDVRGLVQALQRLATDVDLRLRLGRTARKRAVDNFDATRNAERLMAIVADAAHQ